MSTPDVGQVSQYGSEQLIPIEDIVDSPFQVRIDYGDINKLADDIKKRGLLMPILVRPVDGKLEIVHGHRRTRASKTAGLKYIRAFVKEMIDTEAITTQGRENLHRKDYNAIEEATLYVNYQNQVFAEEGIWIGGKKISENFTTSESNVKDKLGLLDLPQSLQVKIVNGDISLSKAVRLLALTKDSDSMLSESVGVSGGRHRTRTDEYYPQIELIVKEIEKGDSGGIRTREGISKVVSLVKAGDNVEDAIVLAKMHESIELAKKRSQEGRTPEEIIAEIKLTQPNADKIMEAAINLNIENVKKQLQSKVIVCPHCGKNDLEWSCQHTRLVEDE